MIRKVRTLGLCTAAVICLTALTAASAQAEDLATGGEEGLFRILGSGLLAIGGKAQGSLENENGKLLIPGLNIQIECESVEIPSSIFTLDTKVFVEALFLQCLTFTLSTGKHISTCAIEDFKPGDRMITAAVYGKPRKHGGKKYILFEIANTAIDYEKEKGCPLPLENNLTGSVAAEINENEVEAQLLQFSEKIQKLLGDTLKFNNSTAYADGSGIAVLIDEHIGCDWGVF